MWCFIYRSQKKSDSYLYIDKQNDFSVVPEALMKVFGAPIFVMRLWLNDERKMMAASPAEIRKTISENGYFLQMLNDSDFQIK
ncbi:YcgL domain-containing protein [Candidatus Schmidhempelia bombi]|jgi:uncharacterized protein|uniref:YcgL domain-containing protein O970_02485 n=1 Tax=Candidatus Schmidhempelia bombi str. Bimp TaxID=1387197 RepID=A0AB94IDU2_9GAMM|nr:YcgL domain-containing protein [Candidatus Schmidhempelia bombi]TEA27634.1 YcgL domain-containing protein [Candidatus Schmidhempelia bombi str. Bimp]